MNSGKITAARRNARFTAVLLGLSLCAGAASAPAAADSADAAAVWVPKELNFQYVGFTNKYTCDGLQAKMRRVLLELGARDDLKVTPLGCMRVNAPETTPGVRIVMHVLQPASAAGQTVAAHWKSVDVLADHNVVDAALDCEFISQLKQDVLPLFTARHVDYSAACAANKALIGGTRLKADVLVPDQDAMPKTASAR